MKRIYLLVTVLFLLVAFKASAQDYVLLPENFFLHKGDKLNLHIITANQFIKQDEVKYETIKPSKFILSAGSKKTDLTTVAKDTATPIVSYALENQGLNMIEYTRKPVTDEIERDDFLKILDDEGMTKESEKAKNGSKDSFRERYTWFMKSLVQVDKNSANNFEKPLNQDLEIILKDNPYKGNYGDDLIGVINFKGSPLVNANVVLSVKAATGNVFVQRLSSDKEGKIYFKLSREGIYLVRTLHMEASKDKNADFETWMASYTFAFSSSNEMPNTYKEFGFGNRH
ncbi:MAG TPA: DUF4198 domain-containing protein [Mucilaginibacter sp.]|nr:DUF4198 domain-containing protein [Mucilaginibacter sp.]